MRTVLYRRVSTDEQADAQKQLREVLTAFNKKVMALLTAEQKEKIRSARKGGAKKPAASKKGAGEKGAEKKST